MDDVSIEKKVLTPLYMCFVDLEKAYDSVDRGLLWKVLARADVPDEMISVIRQFHDGMMPRVRTDDEPFSECFEVTQGLRRSYPVTASAVQNLCHGARSCAA